MEHQICRFAKMILRERCSTSYDLASIVPGRGSTLDRWSGKNQNALVRGHQLCTQLSILKEVLQNCFVFDAVNFKNCIVLDVVKFQNLGSVAE